MCIIIKRARVITPGHDLGVTSVRIVDGVIAAIGDDAAPAAGDKVIDADGLTLGRLATKAAMILRGKDKPQFTPNTDTGDFVVVINADKVVLTGVKADHKRYWRYSGWLGGLKFESYKDAMANHPERVVEHAIKGMLPKTTLGRKQGMKLKVYAGPEHPHAAQNPVKIEVEA